MRSKKWCKGRWFWVCNPCGREGPTCMSRSRYTYTTEAEAIKQGNRHKHKDVVIIQLKAYRQLKENK